MDAASLQRVMDSGEPLELDHAVALLDASFPLEALLAAAEKPRRQYFGNRVRLHILNNIKNGHCAEDCGYCAQRRGAPEDVPAYTTKPEEEILAEARRAFESGAFRYCLVQSGRGPGPNTVRNLARIIKRIKTEYQLEVCLSAGLLEDSASADLLAEAGLDRYNHNLNTSEEHYGEICSTHTFADRVSTLRSMAGAGVELCSGVIVGMGEAPRDLAAAALQLRELGVASIPVNFFLPVPGHAIANVGALTPEFCLRVLAVFRLVNPGAEIRMAAGREFHLGDLQPQALRVANSLFVSGYLNVRGSDAAATIGMIEQAGFAIENAGELERPVDRAESVGTPADGSRNLAAHMKAEDELRPFRGATTQRGAL